MTAAALALLLLAPADTYVRQYADTVYTDALIANPGGADGIHLLSYCEASGDVDACSLAPSFEKAEAARLAGLKVAWGFRTNTADYADPLVWLNSAKLVRRGAGIGSTGLIVLDMENYTGSGAECRIPYDDARALMAPLLEALVDVNMRVAVYPANIDDTCMAVLMDNIGGELWTEYAFNMVGAWHWNRTGRYTGRHEDAERDENLRRRYPYATIRTGLFDAGLRDLFDAAPRPAHTWVFDYPRIGSGPTAERMQWGTPAWESGLSLSTLNDAAQVWAFMPRAPAEALAPFGSKPGDSSGLRWDRAFVGGQYAPAPPLDDRGWTLDQHWEVGLDVTPTPERTMLFEAILPDDTSGPYPIASSWWNHSTVRVFCLYIEGGLIKLALAQGSRSSASYPRVHFQTLGPALSGTPQRVVFGFDARELRTADMAIVLPEDTNSQRGYVEAGYAHAPDLFSGEDHTHPPAGFVLTGQAVVWDRLLSQAEMTEAMTGRYPWGL